MKVTETKYIEEGGYFRIKVDIETDKEKVIGFKVLTHSKKIECELEKGKIKTLNPITFSLSVSISTLIRK